MFSLPLGVPTKELDQGIKGNRYFNWFSVFLFRHTFKPNTMTIIINKQLQLIHHNKYPGSVTAPEIQHLNQV